MKKDTILKNFGLLITLFFIIACNQEEIGNIEDATESQKEVKNNVSESTFICPFKVYANTIQGYIYNFGDRKDYDHIAIYVDKTPEEYDNEERYPYYINLKNNEYAESGIPLPYGKHHITICIKLDDGNGIFETCAALVLSKNDSLNTELFKQKISKTEGNSATDAYFQFEFDIDYPYTTDNTKNSLDIVLRFNDELQTNEHPFIDGNVFVHAYYDWTSILQTPLNSSWDFMLNIINSPTEEEHEYHASTKNWIYKDSNGLLMSNIYCYIDNLRLPIEDNAGYNLHLTTAAWAEFQNGGSIGETEVSWYSAFYREKYNYDGSYTDWYTVDELTSSYIGIDATIDFYTNLEIVCFKTKKIQDIYAPLLGIY